MPRPLMRLPLLSFLGAAHRDLFAGLGALAAAAVGSEPAELVEPGLAHLETCLAEPGPALLFLCGLPYVHARRAGARVTPLAAPLPDGETGPRYWAALVGRAGLRGARVDDLVGLRVGYNGTDSMSGWVLPRTALAEQGLLAALYANPVCTGSHAESLRRLAADELDVAAIDSWLLGAAALASPEVAALPVLARLGPASAPPAVLLGGDEALAARLRDALAGAHLDPAGRAALASGATQRYVPIADADYDDVRERAARHATL